MEDSNAFKIPENSEDEFYAGDPGLVGGRSVGLFETIRQFSAVQPERLALNAIAETVNRTRRRVIVGVSVGVAALAATAATTGMIRHHHAH